MSAERVLWEKIFSRKAPATTPFPGASGFVLLKENSDDTINNHRLQIEERPDLSHLKRKDSAAECVTVFPSAHKTLQIRIKGPDFSVNAYWRPASDHPEQSLTTEGLSFLHPFGFDDPDKPTVLHCGEGMRIEYRSLGQKNS